MFGRYAAGLSLAGLGVAFVLGLSLADLTERPKLKLLSGPLFKADSVRHRGLGKGVSRYLRRGYAQA